MDVQALVVEASRRIRAVLEDEDENFETLLGRLERGINEAFDSQSLIEVVGEIPHGADGHTIASSPENRYYHALEDANDALRNAAVMLDVLRDQLSLARAILLSALATAGDGAGKVQERA